ncbi:unnamed protein product [Miscanthus lutarioriparius]|uniref:Uncharacterized protein n=1 Tax=Miscanthus lutarioriparius TaxID=422564 RepID=A0A811S4T2_9POAL|nr:unnamed protein product [Miscanthus lutarioriparius]
MALRLALRQPPLSCNLVLCIERMAFASSCSSPTANPPAAAAPSNNDPPADAATNPPAPPPVEAPTAPCPCPADGSCTGTHAPEGEKAGGDVPPADPSHRGPPITHGYYTPTHQPHDP